MKGETRPESSRGVRRGGRLAFLAAMSLVLGWLVGPVLRAEIIVNPRGWKFPNIVTSAKEIIRISDRTREIPGKETILKGYRKWDGTFFRTYEVEGKIFGVEIDTDGKPPFEYSLMDADGDGRFETKIPHSKDNKDKAYVPQWIVDHYFRLHPEMKNPTKGTKIPPPSLRPPSPPPEPEEPAPAEPPPLEVREAPSP
jgi:hypothetical protein